MSNSEAKRGRARGRQSRLCEVAEDLSDAMERARIRLPPAPEPTRLFSQLVPAPTKNPSSVTKYVNITSKQGESGNEVEFTANYFPLLTQTDWSLYQYRVDFEPEEDRTAMKKCLLRVHNEILQPYIFDGSVLFVSRKLTKDQLELFSIRPGDECTIRITIKKAGDLSIGDHQYLEFFNSLMRMCLDNLDLRLVSEKIKQYKIDIWPGYITSIRQNENQVLMYAEISHKIMRTETVLDFIASCRCKSTSEEDWKDFFTKSIVGCIVLTEYNDRLYRIHDVDFNATPMSTFQRKSQAPSTYMQYYKNKYNISIKYTTQLMLVSKSKPREIRSGMTEFMYLVPELCRMTGLTEDMRTNYQLMRAVADHTRLTPQHRIDKLNEFSKTLGDNKKTVSDLKLWNMQLSKSLVKFHGRTLLPEEIYFGNGAKTSAGEDADWTRSVRNNAMAVAGQLTNWAVIYLSHQQGDVESFVSILQKSAMTLKYSIPKPLMKDISNDRTSTYINALENVIGRHKPQLIVCIVPNNKADRYSAIKQKCCCDRSVLTQVVVAKNIKAKGVMSIASKIAIQINCKLGGTPWTLSIPLKGLMVCGYDVCHDANNKSRSFSAIVSSTNKSLSRYYSTVTQHKAGEELSNDLPINIMKAAIKYSKINGEYPEKILIYRVGVDGDVLPFVQAHEVENLKGQLRELYKGELPEIGFVVVTKKVPTRIFRNSGSPRPGTIADDCITIPEKYDFFLVSQSVRQGTVSPTSYNVIEDTTRLTPDKMQRITYKMTHLYYNWSGTVRVPAQCQYAHKLACLVSQALNRPPNPGLEELLYFL